MYTDWDIYCAFRKAQANYISRPYRLPKNWEKYRRSGVMAKRSLQNIDLAVKKFNGTWFKIDPERYFETGFKILGVKFTYNRFFNPKIIKQYIRDDKMMKRVARLNKESMIESAKFLKRYMSTRTVNPKLSLARQYTALTEANVHLPISHYLQGKIDKFFLVWLIRRGLVVITKEEQASHIPEIIENYRTYVAALNTPQMKRFLDKLGGKLLWLK